MDRIKQKINDLNSSKSFKKTVTENDLENFGLSGIKLRSYQQDGVNWLIDRYHKGHGCILGDEMGLGKTCQTISFLVYLYGSGKSKGPFLILSPLSVLGNWQNELARFAPNLDVIPYVGKKESREGPLRDRMKKQKGKICVVLTTYEFCLKDSSFLSKFPWHAVVVDEAHRLKNKFSLLHQSLLDFDIGHSVLLTGTPIQNNLKELYSLLSFVAPKIFKEKFTADFEEHFADVNDTQDASELHTMLKPFLLRRVKSEVLKDLPDKTELVLYHGMSALQKKYYRALLTKDISVFENSNQATRASLMNILMQLRKCVNHPYLFDGVEPEPFALGEHLVEASGKLVVLDQMLTYLRSKGHKVLLFSQMTRMLDILQDYLGYRGYSYERLDGSVRGEERYLAVQNFNEDDETFIFLLSTKAGGVGLNLVGADTVIFVDSDFNPQNDLQAAARAHRIGQTRPVKVIRLIGRSTVEEIILRRAEAKLKLTETVIEGGQFSSEAATNKEDLISDKDVKMQDILKFGFDRLFATEESTVEEVDFDAVLGKSEDGEWRGSLEATRSQATMAEASMEIDATEEEVGQSMYVFEGTDYSKEPSAADVQAFEDLIKAQKDLIEEELEENSEARPLRRTKTKLLPGELLSDVTIKTRKPLTEEEKEARRVKREELAEKRAKAAEEEQKRKAEAKQKRREALWRQNGYHSCNISQASEGEEEKTGSEAEEFTPVSSGGDGFNSDEEQSTSNHRQIHYVVGDLTKPQNTDNKEAIIVHCVDDSGVWGSGGLFSALSARSDEPDRLYTLAGQMKDLSLGDAHLVPLTVESGTSSSSAAGQYVCLIVAQHRDRRTGLSGIKLSALSQALQRLSRAATQMKASVHLPRIGHKTPGFNWYGTERLIRKHLALKAVPTYIYYYPRKHKLKRKQTAQRSFSDDSQDSPSNIASTSKENGSPPLKRQRSGSSQHSESSVPSLPTFMSGVQAYFSDIPRDTVKKLTRYLIAYDGDVNKSIKDDTTHVIVADDVTSTQDLQSIQEDLSKYDELKVVKVEWLEQCIELKRRVDAEEWIV